LQSGLSRHTHPGVTARLKYTEISWETGSRRKERRISSFVPHPGGMRDNSPMFQHWEERGKWRPSPEGTAEGSRAVSAVPSGLDDLGTDQPNVETLGYCRMSLRDKVSVDCLS